MANSANPDAPVLSLTAADDKSSYAEVTVEHLEQIEPVLKEHRAALPTTPIEGQQKEYEVQSESTSTGHRFKIKRDPEGVVTILARLGFAVSLLVVSLEVPKSYGELMEMMRGFLPFAICFFIFIDIWWEHHDFFRRVEAFTAKYLGTGAR